MTKPLRVLLVEDSERDAALLLLYLRRGGYQATLERVETGDEMQERLGAGDWDIVVSDVNLPRFGAAAALQLLRDSGRPIPLLVVSGEADERVIQALLDDGAAGFVPKDRFTTVVASIEQAMGAKP